MRYNKTSEDMYPIKNVKSCASTDFNFYIVYAFLSMVKLCRAQGGCLGTKSRRKT